MIPLFKVRMAKQATLERLEAVFESEYIGEGDAVEEFEDELKIFLGSDRRVLTVNSCTSALQLAFYMCGVRDKYVISTPQTCTATNTAILAEGGKILWADVDQFTGNICPRSVKRLLSDPRCHDVAAIACVDWAGVACDYDGLRAVAPGIPIVEDAAHALLTKYKGEPVANSGGDYVCWSFQAIKHLTCGDGGAIVVPVGAATRARLLRWYGLDRTSSASFRCSQNVAEAGFKYHMNNINASIGLANIETARHGVMMSRQIAKHYSKNITPGRGIIFPPLYNEDASYWLYTIHVEKRDEFIEYLKNNDIASSPVHARNDSHDCLPPPATRRLGIDYFSKYEVCIPCGAWMTWYDIEHVIDVVNQWNSIMKNH